MASRLMHGDMKIDEVGEGCTSVDGRTPRSAMRGNSLTLVMRCLHGKASGTVGMIQERVPLRMRK